MHTLHNGTDWKLFSAVSISSVSSIQNQGLSHCLSGKLAELLLHHVIFSELGVIKAFIQSLTHGGLLWPSSFRLKKAWPADYPTQHVSTSPSFCFVWVPEGLRHSLSDYPRCFVQAHRLTNSSPCVSYTCSSRPRIGNKQHPLSHLLMMNASRFSWHLPSPLCFLLAGDARKSRRPRWYPNRLKGIIGKRETLEHASVYKLFVLSSGLTVIYLVCNLRIDV